MTVDATLIDKIKINKALGKNLKEIHQAIGGNKVITIHDLKEVMMVNKLAKEKPKDKQVKHAKSKAAQKQRRGNVKPEIIMPRSTKSPEREVLADVAPSAKQQVKDIVHNMPEYERLLELWKLQKPGVTLADILQELADKNNHISMTTNQIIEKLDNATTANTISRAMKRAGITWEKQKRGYGTANKFMSDTARKVNRPQSFIRQTTDRTNTQQEQPQLAPSDHSAIESGEGTLNMQLINQMQSIIEWQWQQMDKMRTWNNEERERELSEEK